MIRGYLCPLQRRVRGGFSPPSQSRAGARLASQPPESEPDGNTTRRECKRCISMAQRRAYREIRGETLLVGGADILVRNHSPRGHVLTLRSNSFRPPLENRAHRREHVSGNSAKRRSQAPRPAPAITSAGITHGCPRTPLKIVLSAPDRWPDDRRFMRFRCPLRAFSADSRSRGVWLPGRTRDT